MPGDVLGGVGIEIIGIGTGHYQLSASLPPIRPRGARCETHFLTPPGNGDTTSQRASCYARPATSQTGTHSGGTKIVLVGVGPVWRDYHSDHGPRRFRRSSELFSFVAFSPPPRQGCFGTCLPRGAPQRPWARAFPRRPPACRGRGSARRALKNVAEEISDGVVSGFRLSRAHDSERATSARLISTTPYYRGSQRQ